MKLRPWHSLSDILHLLPRILDSDLKDLGSNPQFKLRTVTGLWYPFGDDVHMQNKIPQTERVAWIGMRSLKGRMKGMRNTAVACLALSQKHESDWLRMSAWGSNAVFHSQGINFRNGWQESWRKAQHHAQNGFCMGRTLFQCCSYRAISFIINTTKPLQIKSSHCEVIGGNSTLRG